jgi:class 3 adenylate cyclase/tetratricopeptide (TPR) repeat protein
VALCPVCGEDNPLRANFCLNCGAALSAGTRESARLRKTVTVLFADVVGSTGLAEQLDPESFLKVIGRFFAAMREIIERHGGTVEKFIGDAVMAVFGIPQLREDDALRAVRAAEEMRRELTVLNEELRHDWGVEILTRTGVNTGEVLAGDPSVGDSLIVGDAVNTAARLEQAAGVGEILLGEPTYQLVRDEVDAEPIDPLALKGKGGLVTAYRLRSMTGARAWVSPEGSPFLSRRLELAFLETVYEAAVAEGTCHLVTILGSAGVGKTRLAQEFVAHARAKATVVFGRCLPYGDGITYWPVVEIIKAAASLRDDSTPDEMRAAVRGLLEGSDVASRVEDDLAHLLGLSEEPVSSEELQWAVRKLLEALAAERPLIAVLEDVQWAEQTFLDLIDHILRWSRDVPIILICLGRQELLERRPQWAQERKRATALSLEPLSDAAAETLIDSLAPGLDEDLRSRIVNAAGGLPLFVRSMVSMLVDQHVLRLEDGVWSTTDEVADVSVPPTIQAVLSARLDRLPQEERAAIERASLVGEEFSRGDIEELSSAKERLRLSGVLGSLMQKDLIRPRGEGKNEAPREFRFSHILIRDIAYREMPKESRAQLHERFAGVIERSAGGRTGTYDEILGYHLEQAYRLRAELRPDDRHARDLASRAGGIIKQAGVRAFARHDPHAAVKLLTRAIDLLPDDPERLLLIADLVRARFDLGATDAARADVERALEEARVTGDRRALHRLQIRRDEIWLNVDPAASLSEALARANEAAIAFEELDDLAGLAFAEYFASAIRFWLGQAAISVNGMERALASSGGNSSLAATLLTFEAAALIWGPTPAAEIDRWSSRVLEQWAGVPMAEAAAMIGGAYARALQGDATDARKLANRARSIYTDMGLMVLLARANSVLSLVELIDDPSAAERGLRQSYDLLEEMRDSSFLSTVASLLAQAVFEQGRVAEAEALARRALEAAQPEDVDPQARGRSILALALARAGEKDEAERFARDAVEVCKPTDFVMVQADALRHAGEVFDRIGKRGEAILFYREARALYEAKGNVPFAARVGRIIDEPDSPHLRSS